MGFESPYGEFYVPIILQYECGRVELCNGSVRSHGVGFGFMCACVDVCVFLPKSENM